MVLELTLPVIWVVATVVTFWLLGGGLGLTPVPVSAWGGLPVTLMLAVFGMVLAFCSGLRWHWAGARRCR
ncbi:MAG: hypothetical protein R3E83_02205 [Burkholderiaceae bacterium]